jgi:hypothetical protein
MQQALSNRRGKFRVSMAFFIPEGGVDRAVVDWRKATNTIAIIGCTSEPWSDTLLFYGISPLFRLLKEGEVIPEYELILHDDGTPTQVIEKEKTHGI